MSSPRSRALLVLLALCALAACSEATTIRTWPPGGHVSVNGRPLGQAPVEFSVRSWSVRRHAYHFRIEKPGYLTKEGYLEPHVSIGRIISAAASSCFTCFRGFLEFDEDTEIVLQEEPPLRLLEPQSPGEELRHLQSLYDRGLISEEDLARLRAGILNDASHGNE